jgi:oxalate decarboxylase/phosphoglucose isomerase-like protein (cupin superfamily)|tara:strand:+ start:8077 stop:8634 length:558 start_codon:yes stop_codon:yes gene_type:complete
MKVIKNALSKEKQEWIKNIIFQTSFPFNYIKNMTYKGTTEYRPGFVHTFIKYNEIQSKEATMLNVFKDLIVGNVESAKMFLQIPVNRDLYKGKQDEAHVDQANPHQVYIYYVLDSDGDTIVFKNKKEWKRITPKQGTLVTFDGSLWHTAEQPTKGTRCIMNFNVTQAPVNGAFNFLRNLTNIKFI